MSELNLSKIGSKNYYQQKISSFTKFSKETLKKSKEKTLLKRESYTGSSMLI